MRNPTPKTKPFKLDGVLECRMPSARWLQQPPTPNPSRQLFAATAEPPIPSTTRAQTRPFNRACAPVAGTQTLIRYVKCRPLLTKLPGTRCRSREQPAPTGHFDRPRARHVYVRPRTDR